MLYYTVQPNEQKKHASQYGTTPHDDIQDKTRQDKTRQDKTRQDNTRQYKIIQYQYQDQDQYQ